MQQYDFYSFRTTLLLLSHETLVSSLHSYYTKVSQIFYQKNYTPTTFFEVVGCNSVILAFALHFVLGRHTMRPKWKNYSLINLTILNIHVLNIKNLWF